MKDKTLYVVICDQFFANFFYVVGVYDDLEIAEKVKSQSSSHVIEEFTLNQISE